MITLASRLVTVMVAFLPMFCHGSGALPGVTPDKPSITVKLKVTSIRSGEDVTLVLTIKNVTRENVEFMETYPNCDFSFDITDSAHKIVQMKESWKRAFANRMITRQHKITLKPGEMISYSLDALNAMYEIDKSGVYEIIARRDFDAPAVHIKSNAVTLHVTN